MSQYTLQPSAGFRRRAKSIAPNNNATRASCQNNANGVQTDHGSSRPATAKNLAVIKTQKSARAFMAADEGLFEDEDENEDEDEFFETKLSRLSNSRETTTLRPRDRQSQS